MGAPKGNCNAAKNKAACMANKGINRPSVVRMRKREEAARQWIRDQSVSQPSHHFGMEGRPRSTSIGARKYLRAEVRKARTPMKKQHDILMRLTRKEARVRTARRLY